MDFNEVDQLLRYDHETGELFWKVCRKRRNAGERAGSISATTGRPIITINGKNYLQHRIAWLLYYKEWPEKLIDHMNRNILDNRIANLRAADYSQNGANRVGGNGLKGASLSLRKNRKPVWRASIKINGKTKNLGSFQTEIEAHQAYCAAASAAFGSFSRAA